MNRQELVALLYSNMEEITMLEAAINLVAALICAIVIYAVYYFTSKDTKPTAAFAKTVIMVTLSVTILVMLIGSNLALSLGMVGALSIIRFRAAVKDSRDAAFILYAISASMAAALGIYVFALLGTLFTGIVIIVFSALNIGSRTYMLTIKTYMSNPDIIKELEKAAGRHCVLKAVSSRRGNEDNNTIDGKYPVISETIYEIGMNNGIRLLCDKLMKLEGVLSATIIQRDQI